MEHSFGGDWTDQKLEVLRKYLSAYMTIMKGNERAKHLTTTYLDGFAGSGWITKKGEPSLFSEVEEEDANRFRKGSASIALAVEPSFDKYVFVDTNSQHVNSLQSLVEEFSGTRKSIEIVKQDVNLYIPQWCESLKQQDRALVFLDPYGMQVNWATMESLAKTKKVDVWVLVPLGQAIIRILPNGEQPASWGASLTKFFGTDSWRDRFYPQKLETTLFGDEVRQMRDVDFEGITSFVVERFRTIFAEVLDKPVVLRNRINCPLYLLCFGASNPKGAKPALKIAKDIARGFKDGIKQQH